MFSAVFYVGPTASDGSVAGSISGGNGVTFGFAADFLIDRKIKLRSVVYFGKAQKLMIDHYGL